MIIACPQCHMLTGVKAYMSDTIPECQMCSSKLAEPDKIEIHARFVESLNDLYNLGDPEEGAID